MYNSKVLHPQPQSWQRSSRLCQPEPVSGPGLVAGQGQEQDSHQVQQEEGEESEVS